MLSDYQQHSKCYHSSKVSRNAETSFADPDEYPMKILDLRRLKGAREPWPRFTPNL